MVFASSKPARQLTVLAWLADHPESTAREVATMLADGPSTHSEYTSVYAVLRQLADRGDIEVVVNSYPARWRVAERPSDPLPEPSPLMPRPEYVEVVIERLAALREIAPVGCHHLIDYCMVDLQRALGRVPLLDED